MTHPLRHPVRWLLLCTLGGLSVSALATGCGTTGYSPTCPDDVTLYNVREAGTPKQPSSSIDKGCWTRVGDASSGTAGSPGTGGSPSADAGGG